MRTAHVHVFFLVLESFSLGGGTQPYPLPPYPPLSRLYIFPSPSHPPTHPWNIIIGYLFSHDGHISLHWYHSNQVGIVGKYVVRNAQAVWQFLHFLCAIILVLPLFLPPSPSVLQISPSSS